MTASKPVRLVFLTFGSHVSLLCDHTGHSSDGKMQRAVMELMSQFGFRERLEFENWFLDQQKNFWTFGHAYSRDRNFLDLFHFKECTGSLEERIASIVPLACNMLPVEPFPLVILGKVEGREEYLQFLFDVHRRSPCPTFDATETSMESTNAVAQASPVPDAMSVPTASVEETQQSQSLPDASNNCASTTLKPVHVYIPLPEGWVKLVLESLVANTPEEMGPLLDVLVKRSGGYFETHEDFEKFSSYAHRDKPHFVVFSADPLGPKITSKLWNLGSTCDMINHAILFAREQCPTSAPYLLVFAGNTKGGRNDQDVIDALAEWRKSFTPQDEHPLVKWHKSSASDQLKDYGRELQVSFTERPEWIRRQLGEIEGEVPAKPKTLVRVFFSLHEGLQWCDFDGDSALASEDHIRNILAEKYRRTREYFDANVLRTLCVPLRAFVDERDRSISHADRCTGVTSLCENVNRAISLAMSCGRLSEGYAFVFLGYDHLLQTTSAVNEIHSRLYEYFSHVRGIAPLDSENDFDGALAGMNLGVQMTPVDPPTVPVEELSRVPVKAATPLHDIELSAPKAKRVQQKHTPSEYCEVLNWFSAERLAFERRYRLGVALEKAFEEKSKCAHLNPSGVDLMNDLRYALDAEAFLRDFAKYIHWPVPTRGHPVLFEALRVVGFRVEPVVELPMPSSINYNEPGESAFYFMLVSPSNK